MLIETFTGGPFLQNGYIATCQKSGECVIVDPGAATQQMLKHLNVEDRVVTAVILTHGHFDHIEGLGQVREHTQAPVWLHPLDQEIFDNFPVQAAQFGVQGRALSSPDKEFLGKGEGISFGESSLKVYHTPGHSPGHVILVNREAKIALVGDLVFRGSVGRTDLPGGDSKVLFSSIKEHILTLPDDFKMFSGHGPATTVGHERENNPFFTGSYMGNSPR